MKKPITLLIISFIFFTSCFTLKPVTVGDVTDFKFKDLTSKSVSVILQIPIKNENNFKFKITDVNIDISVDGNSLGRVKKIEKIIIQPNSVNTYTFELKAEFSKLAKGSFSILKSFMKRSIDMHLEGYIKVKAFMFTKKLDINENKHISMSQFKLF